jgi:hypothetical protein
MTRTTIGLLAFLALALPAASSQWVLGNKLAVTPKDGTAGVSVTPDATTPSKGAMRLGAQDTAPTGCAVGDLAVVGTKLEVCTAVDTWTVVGNQGCIADGQACDGDPVCCSFGVCNTTCVCSAVGGACVTADDCCPGDGCVCTDIGAGLQCVQL